MQRTISQAARKVSVIGADRRVEYRRDPCVMIVPYNPYIPVAHNEIVCSAVHVIAYLCVALSLCLARRSLCVALLLCFWPLALTHISQCLTDAHVACPATVVLVLIAQVQVHSQRSRHQSHPNRHRR